MITVYSNSNNSVGRDALSASRQEERTLLDRCPSFDHSRVAMKKAIERDLSCLKGIKW